MIPSIDMVDTRIIVTTGKAIRMQRQDMYQQIKPDVPLRMAFSNFEHLMSLSPEHRNTQTVENTVWITL